MSVLGLEQPSSTQHEPAEEDSWADHSNLK